ncbi:CAP domain-containing protein [Phyllosticta capitalensis]|uniref:CAP domain-containing protein n=1 Tax=Phyllosticta capitalensis TaxID=121624 RepID=A0ABR1Z0C9_9PEZI
MTLINTVTKPAPTPTANATMTGTASFGGLLPIATGIPSSSPDFSFADDVTFAAGILDAVNRLRAKHDAQPVVWNATLATYAGWWANGCNFTKSFSPYTELLLQNASSPTSSVVDTWADTSYTPASARRADNFTALIWKASSSIGCGRQQCSGKPTGSPFVDPNDLLAKQRAASGSGWDGKEKDESEGEGELGVFHGSPPPANTGADAVKAAGWFIVCELAPQGNVDGQYAANVDGWGDGSGRGEGWRQEGVLGKSKDSGAGMAAGAGKEKIAVWAGWVFTGLAVGMGVWA